MFEQVELKAVIENLYMVLLDRIPHMDEIEPYLQRFANGADLEDLARSIAGSEEAKLRLIRRAMDSLTLQDLQGVRCERPVEISADDLMYTLAQSYEAFTGRQPTFVEVARRFKAIVNGAHLTDQISEISDSEEAVSRRSKGRTLDSREKFSDYISTVYNVCLGRNILPHEIDFWYNSYIERFDYRDILLVINECEEALASRARGDLTEWAPGVFVQLLYEVVLGHGATPGDIAHHAGLITDGVTSRQDLLSSLFVHAARIAYQSKDAPSANDPSQALLFGRSEPLTIAKWRERGRSLLIDPAPETQKFTRFAFSSDKRPLVSIITSLFKGGRFFDQFMENITTQSIFREYCELIIIDANSPDGEYEKAEKYIERFPNINYKRCPYRVGIYEAWNLGISSARGTYCTNANLDDCRRGDSLELQASVLEALPFVDIVYQDVLYSFDENMRFEEIEQYGFQTDLPIISRYNLLESNSPHNAPMWRKQLHDEVGLFNTSYVSAGDAEFWMRCHLAGKIFYKVNDPHVAYYNNPQGLSTRSDTPGAAESRRISKIFNRRLISPDLTMTDDLFAEKIAALAGGPTEGRTRYAMAQAALRHISVASRATAE